MAATEISIRNLQVQYGHIKAVHIAALDLLSQEILAIVGPNGAGKSTLLRVMGLLEKPAEGTVIFQGQPATYDPRSLLLLHRRMAMVFQEPLLLKMTVAENIAIGLKFRRLTPQATQIKHWLDRFGIAHLHNRPARLLSGGEARRASLARAFILNPEILLLDEPFSALDAPTQNGLMVDLKTILAETRTTTVFVTHNLNEARMLADRMAVMMAGQMVQVDHPDEVFSHPATVEAARFLGMENCLLGHVLEKNNGQITIKIARQKIILKGTPPHNKQIYVCIRPENIRVAKKRTLTSTLSGRVNTCVKLGQMVRVVVDCGIPVVAQMPKEMFDQADLHAGDEVSVLFLSQATHLI